METPLQFEVHGFRPSAHVRELIESNVQKIEARYGRITSCRLVVRAPEKHHRMGEPYAVSIHMALPDGREVNVGHASKGQDRRRAEVGFAIVDAFRRAVRQLRDQSRKLRGDIKQHDDMPIGKITVVHPEKSFGFLEAPDGREIYFHAHSVRSNAFAKLLPGDRVAFHEEAGVDGPQASTIHLLRRGQPQKGGRR